MERIGLEPGYSQGLWTALLSRPKVLEVYLEAVGAEHGADAWKSALSGQFVEKSFREIRLTRQG